MINDICVIVWKEWREFFFQLSIRSKFNILIAVVFIGVMIPISNGEGWFNTMFFYTMGLIGPLLTTTTIIADLFIGERERHTFETLLASRLSDKGIVTGKILFAVNYSIVITLIILVASIIAINIEYYKDVLILPSIRASIIVIVISALLSLFTSLLGSIISIRVNTVKQGQLLLTVLVLASLFITEFLITNYLPAKIKLFFLHTYQQLGSTLSFTLGSVIFLMINLLLLTYVFGRYKRLNFFL